MINKSKHDGEIVDTYMSCGCRVSCGIKARSDALASNERKLGAVVVLFDEDGNILLQKRTGTRSFTGKWDFTAGGGAKSGENSKDAVLREFKEETGLDYDLIIDEPFAVGRTADWLIVYYAQIVNRAKFAKCETMKSDEVSEFQWFSFLEYERLRVTGKFRDDVCRSVHTAVVDIYSEIKGGIK